MFELIFLLLSTGDVWRQVLFLSKIVKSFFHGRNALKYKAHRDESRDKQANARVETFHGELNRLRIALSKFQTLVKTKKTFSALLENHDLEWEARIMSYRKHHISG